MEAKRYGDDPRDNLTAQAKAMLAVGLLDPDDCRAGIEGASVSARPWSLDWISAQTAALEARPAAVRGRWRARFAARRAKALRRTVVRLAAVVAPPWRPRPQGLTLYPGAYSPEPAAPSAARRPGVRRLRAVARF